MLLIPILILVTSYDNCLSQYVRPHQIPTWQPQPNLAVSFNGIDLPKRGPLRFEPSDPSIRGQLFQPTAYQAQTNDYFALDFYTYNERVICTTDFESKHYTNYEDYSFDSSTSTIVGFDLSYTGLLAAEGSQAAALSGVPGLKPVAYIES